MKIKNIRLANQQVSFSIGLVQFDSEGVADIVPDEFAQQVLTLPNFHLVQTGNSPKTVGKVDAAESLDIKIDGQNLITDLTQEQLDELTHVCTVDENMSHDELDAVAKSLIEEGRLKEEDYPVKKAKKEKVVVINSVS